MNIKVSANKAQQKVPRESVTSKNIFTREINLFGSKMNDKKKERFYGDLKTLLAAGVDLKSALEIIIEEQSKEKDRQFFEEIYDAVIKGKSLSDALKLTGKFSEYEFFSIAIGEESNELHAVLEQLTNYYADQTELKKQIVSVLSYPAFVLIITLGIVYFMMTNVIPLFIDVFRQFGGELPALTLTIVGISQNFGTYLLILFGIIISIVLFVRWQKDNILFRRITAGFFLRIPKIGYLIKLIYLSRFTQSMQLLLASKTPLVRSLILTNKMVKFYPIEKSLDKIITGISEGKTLHEGMREFSFYPKRMISMVKVGEQVNQLDEMLKKVSKQYGEELKYQTKIIGKIMEPLVLLVISVIVGTILVAMYMPMFNLSTILSQ